jgi:hypothetical protein
MKFAAMITRSLQAGMQAELRDLERAVTAGTKAAGQGLKTELRRQMASAGLGQRLANSWRDRHYPNQKLDAASLVSTKAPQIIRAFDEGLITDEADIVVPVDPRYLGLWLTGLFGEPDTTDNLDGSWDHEFASLRRPRHRSCSA